MTEKWLPHCVRQMEKGGDRGMRYARTLIAILSLVSVAALAAAGSPGRGVRSVTPGKRWENAFVTGNGRMGAMLFGSPTNETLVADHCRLFLPLGNREIVPDLARHVPELRCIIREKGYGDAMKFFLGKAKEQGYPREQIAVIQNADIERLPRVMSYIGNLGIGTRGAERAGFWDTDQLYNLRTDPDERIHLAADPRPAEELKRLRAILTADLKANGRPFGEFVPGGNAAPPGQIDKQIAQVKKLAIQGKTVILPSDGDEDEKPAPPGESKREDRRKKRADR